MKNLQLWRNGLLELLRFHILIQTFLSSRIGRQSVVLRFLSQQVPGGARRREKVAWVGAAPALLDNGGGVNDVGFVLILAGRNWWIPFLLRGGGWVRRGGFRSSLGVFDDGVVAVDGSAAAAAAAAAQEGGGWRRRRGVGVHAEAYWCCGVWCADSFHVSREIRFHLTMGVDNQICGRRERERESRMDRR